MKKWIEPPEIEVPASLRAAVGGHPLVAESLARRGIVEVEAAMAFLDPAHYRPAPPTELPNMTRAADRMERAIREGETICVWGDFDVDGQTATTTLVSALEELGGSVRYHVPNRKAEGHGVNLPVLKRLIEKEEGGIDLLLTCDTGVTAHEPIAYAQAQGVDVVVTDHHDLPPTLPPAHAVVDPKMLPESHPLRQLPGVGCAYKLAQALYGRAGRLGDVARYHDLVALGIVADVAEQTGDTRYLLQQGLEALRHTERLGLRVLMELAELNRDWLTEEHIAYELAPRLNALGRLADATVAVEFLTTEDEARARIVATELEGLNARRKLLCNQVAQAAEAQIERDPSLLEQGALVLNHPAWPAGVIGIVAGRLAERYNRPTILIAAPPGELARGSARSVPGCDISAAIAAHGEMLEGFGGHPMAAGLSIDPERIPEFRRALSRTVRETCGAMEEQAALQIDAYVPLADLSLDLVRELERLSPFGAGNPPPVLASRGLTMISQSPVGRNDEHLQVIVQDETGQVQKVIWWQGGGAALPQGRFDLAYVVRASDYRGQRDVQVEWVDARPLQEEGKSEKEAALQPTIRVVDYRQSPDPGRRLDDLRAEEEDLQVWSEAQGGSGMGEMTEIGGRGRYELVASRALAIWTAPPGPAEFQAALESVSPERIYLFGVDPGLDAPEPFLRRLSGLVKRALNAYGGRVSLSKLAAATAQREAAVQAGLRWLAARGYLALVMGQGQDQDGDELQLSLGPLRPSDSLDSSYSEASEPDLPRIEARLKALLQETAAYRAYFARADEDALVRS